MAHTHTVGRTHASLPPSLSTQPDGDDTARLLAAFPTPAATLAAAPPSDPARAAAVAAVGLAGGLVGFGSSFRPVRWRRGGRGGVEIAKRKNTRAGSPG